MTKFCWDINDDFIANLLMSLLVNEFENALALCEITANNMLACKLNDVKSNCKLLNQIFQMESPDIQVLSYNFVSPVASTDWLCTRVAILTEFQLVTDWYTDRLRGEGHSMYALK